MALFASGAQAQTVLFDEDFEGGHSFTLNTTDMNSVTNSTNNKWVVNNAYAGGLFGLIPNTPAQPAGITSPNGNYLHVLSNLAETLGILNSNFQAPGDITFARMSADVSTIGMEDVAFSFWWLCQGGPNNYGEVYYSTDAGGTWTQLVTASPASGQYRAQGSWTQQSIALPAFDGQATLRFGFRFVNSGSAAQDPGFSIDDVRLVGTPAGPSCTTDLVIEFNTDGNAAEIAWSIEPLEGGTALCSGSGMPNNAQAVTFPCCLPDGCFRLVVTDAGGDGIAGGGYVLRTADGDRIIDDRGNFTDGSESSLANGEGFCLPMGVDRPIFTSCDRYWWESGNYLVATVNPAVSAEFGITNATSGYEFWFFDPNGGLSFRKFRNHATSDGFGPNNAARACHIKLNNWAVANHLQDNVLYNVRIRGVIDGTELPYGPACRVTLDPVLNACPPTSLNDIPGHPNFSCGATRVFGGPNSPANRVYARSVAGANKYEFEFTNPGEGYAATVQSNTVIRHLNWSVAPPMNPGSIYQVRVRASKDGGATWCAWGWPCDVTIAPGAAPGGENFAGLGQTGVVLWPNPNNGGQLWMEVAGLAQDVRTFAVDVHDLSGKRVAGQEVQARQGALQLDLGGALKAGTYVVIVTAGDQRHVERLVIME
jgi:hypothetical protein